MFKIFIEGNTVGMRFARTVVQGLIAALVVFVPSAVGTLNLEPSVAAFATAGIMAVLSPLMALLKTGNPEDGVAGE